MNKFSFSLFTRLYLTTLLVIFGVTVLIIYVDDMIYEQGNFNDFVENTEFIFARIKPNALNEMNANQKYIQVPFPFSRELTARFVDASVKKAACTSCQLIKSSGNNNYYKLEEGGFLAEYRLTNSKNNIIIYEILASERSEEKFSVELEDQYEDEILYSMLSIISLFLAVIIYWPIRKLQTQIKALIDSNNQFGLGDLTVRANTNIQKPLDKLAHSFNEMAHAIADNVKERDTFSQAIPHEVRTPLSRIQLASGLIRKISDDVDILQLADDVDNYVVDINELINQIVEFSRINTQKIDEEFEHYQSINVKDYIESRLSIFVKQQHKEITLDVDAVIEIITNPIYLRLLIDNFIKNALNYAKEKIKLSASINNNTLSLMVEDDGVGISPDDRDTIFIPFARLDKSRSRKTGGLGLGLSIAKAAAQRMNGQIIVSESSLGGAKFTFDMTVYTQATSKCSFQNA